MTPKEIYCCGRAEYLYDQYGYSISEGYAIAEKEWEEKHKKTR